MIVIRNPIHLIAAVLLAFVPATALAAPFLGVVLGRPSEANQGATVTDVIDKSPAESAKLSSGDVIVWINDTRITSALSLIETIRSLKPGQETRLTYLRAGVEKSTTVTLGERPALQRAAARRAGVGIALRQPDESGKLVVAAIFPGSAAEAAGIKPGDVLLQFDGNKVESYEQLVKLVRTRKAGDQVLVKIRRQGKAMKLTVELREFTPRRQP